MTDRTVPRLCQEPGCDNVLALTQRKFCGVRHQAAFRQRRRRQERLEERLFGPLCDVDEVVLRVVDLESAAYLVDAVALRVTPYRDDDPATYHGVETIRAVADCLHEAERKHVPRHVLAASLYA